MNDELVQDATTDTLLFPFGQLVADLSRLVTLEPGDVLLTGTPTGASVVRPGDVVEVEVTAGELSTGRLRNPVTEGSPLAPYGAMPKAGAAERAAAYGAAYEPEPLLDAGLADGLAAVAVATLSAQLRARGLPHMSIDGVRPVGAAGMVGVAHTLRYLPLREDLLQEVRHRHERPEAGDRGATARPCPGDGRRAGPTAGTLGDILALRALRRVRPGSSPTVPSATAPPSEILACPYTRRASIRPYSDGVMCPGTPACRSPAAAPWSSPAT